MPDVLVFALHGPLASWGEIAPGEQRGSWARPSKSAVIGLIAAALGIPRHRADRLGELHSGLGFAVAIDRPGLPLSDYHTTQAPTGVALRRQAKSLQREVASWAEALEADTLSTVLSRRAYYVSPAYRVAIWHRAGTDAPDLAALADALARPRFQLYLGRKACPPSRPLAPEIVAAARIQDAFAAVPADDIGARQHGGGRELWCDLDAPGAGAFAEQQTRRDAWRSSQPWRFDPREEGLLYLDEPESAP